MAKYLQDLYIYVPTPPFCFSKAEEERFYAETCYLWDSTRLEYIAAAEKMGHSKAKNILLNLKMNPDERNINILMRTPGKSKK